MRARVSNIMMKPRRIGDMAGRSERTRHDDSHKRANITPVTGSMTGKYRRLAGVHSGISRAGMGMTVMNVIVMMSESNMRAK